jgi:hypothetical protein
MHWSFVFLGDVVIVVSQVMYGRIVDVFCVCEKVV